MLKRLAWVLAVVVALLLTSAEGRAVPSTADCLILGKIAGAIVHARDIGVPLEDLLDNLPERAGGIDGAERRAIQGFIELIYRAPRGADPAFVDGAVAAVCEMRH